MGGGAGRRGTGGRLGNPRVDVDTGSIDVKSKIGLSPTQTAAITGAPNGAKVLYEAAGDKVYVTINHKDVSGNMIRIVSKGKDGKIVVENKIFSLKPGARGKGLGAKMLGQQVTALQKQGGGTIKADAMAGGSFTGYYVWPRMGYSGSLSAPQKYFLQKSKRLPASARNAQDVSDLMKTKSGRKWWRKNGQSIDVTFDASKGSANVKAFNNFAKEKGYDFKIPE